MLRALGPAHLSGGRGVVDASGTLHFDWPGATLTFAVKGAQRVLLRMDGGRCCFTVTVGERPPALLRTKAGVVDYLIASGLDVNAVTNITVRKRTEPRAVTGMSIFRIFATTVFTTTSAARVVGVLLDAGAGSAAEDAELLPGPPPPPRRIEFVGDSDMCGFGNLSRHSGFLAGLLRLGHLVGESDATAAWPLVVADALGAEAHMIAWSGVGAVWNATGTPAKENMCALYPLLLGSEPRLGEVSAGRARIAMRSVAPVTARLGAGGRARRLLAHVAARRGLRVPRR